MNAIDKIILGLLILQSRTMYDIKVRIEEGMNMMYSSSFGSIQAAIKKLLALRFIEFSEVVENGKYKKLYSITTDGIEEFSKWVNTPMRANQSKNPDLTKLYFMGLSDKKTRQKRIEEYIESLQEMYNTIKIIYDEGSSLSVPDEHKDLFNYQYVSVKYGLDALGFEIKWHKKLLSDIKEGVI